MKLLLQLLFEFFFIWYDSISSILIIFILLIEFVCERLSISSNNVPSTGSDLNFFGKQQSILQLQCLMLMIQMLKQSLSLF